MERGQNSPQGDPNKNLEGLFAEHFDELVGLYEGVTDASAAFANPDMSGDLSKVRDFTDKLLVFMFNSEPSPEANEAAYLTLQLVYATYAYASKTNPRVVWNDFFEALAEVKDKEKLAAYANSHGTVLQLMEKLRPLVDPSDSHTGLVSAMALVTCMAIEKDMAKQDWKDVDMFAVQLEQWEGNIEEITSKLETSPKPVDAELLKSGQDIRDYMKAVNKQLETMEAGDERDAFADAVRVELNTAWAELGMMGTTYTFSGYSVFPELDITTDEDGEESVACGYCTGNISAAGTSLGFAYRSLQGKPKKLWYRVDMGFYETELHPTLTRKYSLEAYFDEDSTLSLAEDDTATGSIMSEAELAMFNEIDDPDDVGEAYLTDAAQILSICSQGLRRRMNSRAFQALPHDQQLHVIDLFIAAATERSEVVNKTAVFEPHHGYVMRASPDDPTKQRLTKVQFGTTELMGKVREITVHDIDMLLARPIRSSADRSLTVPGLLVAVELEDTHMLPNNVILRPSEQVLVPVSGQDFDGTFTFIPEQPEGQE